MFNPFDFMSLPPYFVVFSHCYFFLTSQNEIYYYRKRNCCSTRSAKQFWKEQGPAKDTKLSVDVHI